MTTIEPVPSNSQEILRIESRLTSALKEVSRDVLIRHKRAGEPVVGWKDGRTILMPAEEIVIPPAAE